MKRLVLNILKTVAGAAAVVFWFCPVRTGIQLLIFFTAMIVMIICSAIAHNLDEPGTGYWPDKPVDWSANSGDKSAIDEGK